MRKWHRWLSFVFGAFLFFIAVTGVLSHVAAMYARGAIFEQSEHEKPAVKGAASQLDGASKPASPENIQKPKNPKRKLVGFLHHLHSGETFGPVGVIISLLSGLVMIFFAFSGLWLYFQMFVRRRRLGKPDLFWD